MNEHLNHATSTLGKAIQALKAGDTATALNLLECEVATDLADLQDHLDGLSCATCNDRPL